MSGRDRGNDSPPCKVARLEEDESSETKASTSKSAEATGTISSAQDKKWPSWNKTPHTRASGGAVLLENSHYEDGTFQLIDKVTGDYDEDDDNDDIDSSESDSYSYDGDSDVPEEEIDALLEEGLPEEMKGPRKRRRETKQEEEDGEAQHPPHYEEREKMVLVEKGANHFEILPEGWVQVTHTSGNPVYLHRPSRVCTMSKPYFLGQGSVRKHDIPVSAVPCLQYLRALLEEASAGQVKSTSTEKTTSNDIEGMELSKTQVEMASSIDELVDNIGFGSWQILYTLTTCLIRASRAMQYINTVFVNRPTNTEYYYYEPQNKTTHESLVNIYEYCEHTSPYLTSYVCGNTFYNEFEHFGDKAWLSTSYQTVFNLGCMVGACLGTISDLFGRVLVIRVSAFAYLASGILISVSPNIHLVLIARFIIGLSDNLIVATSATLLMEITPKKYMTDLGLLLSIPYAVGAMTLAGTAYLVRSWRTLHLICSVPAMCTAMLVCFIRKSPRWLLTQGHVEEAVDVIVDAARVNKQHLPHKKAVISSLAEYENRATTQIDGNTEGHNSCTMFQKIRSMSSSSFATPHMRIMTIIIPTLWFITSLVFYGLTLNGDSFTTNIYLYVSLTNGFNIIPSLVGTSLVSRIGNKYTYMLLSIMTGLCLLGLLTLPIKLWWVNWSLILVAFMASGLQNTMNFVMTNELLPTVLRNTGCGISLMAGNLGIILSSYLFNTIALQVWWLPTGVCAMGCLITTCLVFLLPETHGRPLCDTVEQVEERGNGYVNQ